jgi:glucose/arabinose dehydrogenase
MKKKTWFGAAALTLGSCALLLSVSSNTLAQGLPEFTLETINSDISMPWGMAWLPGGDMLVTDRNGEIFRVSNGETGDPLGGVPEVHTNGQGGLLDIVLHPDYATTGWIYLSYASEEGVGEGSNTAIIRAKLDGNRLTDHETLYKGAENSMRGQHYGGRMIFDNDGYLYFSIGDRGDHFTNVQDLSRDGGKIYRLNDDGSVPSDNPFVDQDNAHSAIWSYGHRNPQGIDINPVTGQVWASEHGPRGGDEINIAEAGKNYGWPYVGYGINYNGEPLAEATSGEGIEQPIWYWDPSIAVAGIAFVTSDRYPELQNHLLVGALRATKLELLEIHDDRVLRRTDLLTDIGRVRAVSQGPDGYVYLGIDGEGIKRLVPSN